jgi:hypothetical protein
VTTQHEQVPVKVTAFVDKGLCELIEVLNSFNGLWSSASCEGDDTTPASIQLRYGTSPDYRLTCVAANNLAKLVAAELTRRDDAKLFDFNISISVQWCGNLLFPFILIELSHEHIQSGVRIFSSIRERFSHDTCNKPQFD